MDEEIRKNCSDRLDSMYPMQKRHYAYITLTRRKTFNEKMYAHEMKALPFLRNRKDFLFYQAEIDSGWISPHFILISRIFSGKSNVHDESEKDAKISLRS